MVLWDVPIGMQKAVLATELNYAGVTKFSFSADGRFLASSHRDGTVRLFDVATTQQKTTFTGHTGEVLCVSFSPDGKTLVSGSYDKTVRVWDVVTGEVKATLEKHNEIIKSVAFSPDGKTIASASVDGTVFLWDLTSPTNTNQHPR